MGGQVELPKLVLHAVKHYALATVLEILVNGFEHGAHSRPYGIYSVDPGSQGKLVKSYDGGGAVVVGQTGSQWTSVPDLLLTKPGSTRSGSRAGTEVQCLVFAFIGAWLQGCMNGSTIKTTCTW